MELSVLVSIVLLGSPEKSFELLQVLDGFSKKLIASEPEIMDPVAFCFDDDGNILVAESFRQEQGVEDNRSSEFWLAWDLDLQSVHDRLLMYEYFADQRINGMEYYSEFEDRIRLLQDIDRDGVFETATILVDGFNSPLDGTGAGVLAMNGDVWYTNIPHVWLLSDTNSDGVLETQQSLFGEVFGVRTALRGHDMHGLALGLDGRLYWSIGDRGYHIELEDGTVLHSPGEGAVFRSELDGHNIEVFHHGLRNPQELAFDKYGNLFTGDNNSDSEDKARLVYCVEGGETGWRMEYQTLSGVNERGPWVTENGWDPHAEDRPAWILPAVSTLGSGPSGLVAYPGAGFSERYNDHFFMCDFRGGAEYSNVISFALESDGAHFTLIDEHLFVEKVLCTDVDFGYNGKMVVSDWGEGWTGNYEGRLYAIWDNEHLAEGDVSTIFSDGFKHRTTSELLAMLSHVDRRVRIRAQYELAERRDGDCLVSLLYIENQLARIHAMWALAMIERNALLPQMQHIIPLLQDCDPEIRAQACRILGEARHEKAFSPIVALIDDPSTRVSYFATIAAGHLGDACDAILSMLQRNDDSDVYLRHAGVVALANSQYASTLVNLQTNPSKSIRLAAVLALRKLKSYFLADYLNDADDAVATEAARAIHDARIKGAQNALATSLLVARTIPWQKRAISASKMKHGLQDSIRVVEFSLNESNPEVMRIVAIQALRHWDPGLQLNRDIVEGRVISSNHFDRFLMADIQPQLSALVVSAEGKLLLETMQLIREMRMTLPVGFAKKLVFDELIPIEIRTHALRHTLSADIVSTALQSDRWELRAVAREVMQKRDRVSAREELLNAVHNGEVQEAQRAIVALGNDAIGFSQIDTVNLPIELQLDFAYASGNPLLFGDPIDGFWLQYGGHADEGKRIVFENTRSECLRCHKIEGRGGIAGPVLDDIAITLTVQQLQDALLLPNVRIADGFGGYSAMPPMGALLDHRELRDVIAYLKTLRQGSDAN